MPSFSFTARSPYHPLCFDALTARKIVTELTDDLDGAPADETVSFALDGRVYSIDLSTDDATALRKAYAAYISAGRSIRQGRSVRRPAPASGPSAAEIWKWAVSQDYAMSRRGRIPAPVREAYHAAH